MWNEQAGSVIMQQVVYSPKHGQNKFNRPVQKCSLSDSHKAPVYGRFLGILFILSFCHPEFEVKKNSLFFAALKLN
jgi:hypothetical protein